MIENARNQIYNEPSLSPGIKALFALLISVIQILAGKRIAKNSNNSNVPSSMDPNREKKPKANLGKKPGGQVGHPGITLQQSDNLDAKIEIKVNREWLPTGIWKDAGNEKGQVFDLKIVKHITEYRAEIVVNEKGEQVITPFPEGLAQRVLFAGTDCDILRNCLGNLV